VVLLVLAFVCVASLLGGALTSDFGLTNDPESQRAEDLIASRLGESQRSVDVVVVRSPTATVDEQAFRMKVDELVQALSRTEAVAGTRTYYASRDSSLVSGDRHATLVPLEIRPGTENNEGAMAKAIDTVRAADGGRFDVTITGKFTTDEALQTQSQEDLKHGEFFFGAPAALVILLLVFGTVVAGIVPLLMAITAIVITLGVVALLGQVFEVSIFAVNMVTGMGLALGIDYSLFILSRYREERRGGLEKVDAIRGAGGTASRAVLFSGMAFVLALLGMFLVPDLILRSLAAGAVIVGFISVLAALTLLPAILTLLGDRVDALPLPLIGPAAAKGGSENRFWGRIVRAVMRRPVLSLVLSAGVLIAAAVPITSYDTGFAGTSTLPDKTAAKQGFVALHDAFPRGSAEPVFVAIDGSVSSPRVRAAIDRFTQTVAADPRFGEPSVRAVPAKEFALVTVPQVGESQSKEGLAAAEDVRKTYVPRMFRDVDVTVLVGGEAATTIDYTDTTGFWMPFVFAFVLGLSLVLLTIAFRSIVVATKAILLNLLSVGAAYGLLVLVFVKGVGADLLGFQQVDSIVAWVPLFLFSVLFGLSMDYHVFLLSRIRERFLETGDNEAAVEQGVASTARLITGAALIIIAVFIGFALGDLVMFQQMGFGIAVALFLDATIIRSVLVPASMKLLGRWNWYLPAWLRWLPDVHVEGEGARGATRPASSPAR
jgi:uncharacterized membrane protein YdfJ with MMPL/SSD domain